jgi:hypothetical protein
MEYRGIEIRFQASTRPALHTRAPGLTQPIQWIPGVKQQESEAHHSPPSIARFKNGGTIPPLPYMPSWYSAYLIKYGDKFI